MNLYALPDFAVLSAKGPDAAAFLQGQLSNDVQKLTVGAGQLTALHTVQGRVQALLRLFRVGETDYAAALPRELLTDVMQTLTKRQFRSKFTLRDAGADWHVAGASAAPTGVLTNAVDAGGRCLVLSSSPMTTTHGRDDWRALDIAAGVPQVYASTQGEFVAQMLNLDLLGAISFDKGCYIGQEIIARAHYRGRVKRRLQRFELDTGAPLAPGASMSLPSGDNLQIVEAMPGAGRRSCLAVANTGCAGALPLPYDLP
jgi:folate-binding protein YgfZ